MVWYIEDVKSLLEATRQPCHDHTLKGLFHPACLARVISWFASVVAIFMGHENGGKQRSAKRQHVQGMLDETDPLILLCLINFIIAPHKRK